MAIATQAESVIKNIIKEISTVCFSMDYKDPETLAAFMVKAVVLDPDNMFDVERPLTKEDVQRLIQVCVKRLSDSTSPALDTVKMQIHFEMNYSLKEQYLSQHAHVLDSRVLPIFKDIADFRARNRDELDALYRKIVCYAILHSGLGLPTQMPVLRAVNAALQSVFPQTELGAFMSINREDKKKQLTELSDIVTGIRLFNWASARGGEGIEDLPQYLSGIFDDTVLTLDRELSKALKLAFEFTGVLLGIIRPPPCPVEPSLLVMKQCLINCRQYESFLKVLMLDVKEYPDYLRELNQELSDTLEALKSTVRSKAAVPTSHVYPLFTKVAHIWAVFQSEVVYITILQRLLESLVIFTRNAANISENPEFAVLRKTSAILTDDQRRAAISATEGRVSPEQFHNSSFLFPETTKNFDILPLEFQGYCGYSFTVYDRLLLPTQPSIGVLSHKGKFYAFSGKKAAVEFAEHADEFLEDAIAKSKKSPEVIQLLNMHSLFQTGAAGYGSSCMNMIHPPVIKCDSGTQTDTHFMESNLVKSYEWNEWELRRKAIKLADLRQRVTHAVQTDLSHFRRENDTQAYPLRSVKTQTKRERSSIMPRPATYIAGLRGKGEVAQKVDITVSDKVQQTR